MERKEFENQSQIFNIVIIFFSYNLFNLSLKKTGKSAGDR